MNWWDNYITKLYKEAVKRGNWVPLPIPQDKIIYKLKFFILNLMFWKYQKVHTYYGLLKTFVALRKYKKKPNAKQKS